MSLNHYSPGSVVDFLHRKVAGLDAAEPGYRRILIHPMPGGGLTSARATYESAYGLIGSEWAVENGCMGLNVIIPANTRAVVRLPGATAGQVVEGGVPLSQAEGVAKVVQIGADTEVELGSGAYRFEYPIL
jgi:alpha-L-rhamnosidase